MKKSLWLVILGIFCLSSYFSNHSIAQDTPPVYVTFWFDTEDFILPQADDAAKRLADMFTQRHVQATFKIVGEKAKVLEERGRDNVILALSKNDIAYHSTFHSVHPTPSEYSRDLNWQEGVNEFIRREGVGLEILQRVFGVNASCYGQPGGSWTPQSYAALREFKIPLYLDVTSHVNVKDRPFWYCGVLNILELGDCVLRTGWSDAEVKQACDEFDQVQQKLIQEGGGIVSIFYHPCEFVHQQFWDGVNFSHGENPPKSEWKLPPMKTPEEQEQAFKAFETFLDHIIGRPGIELVTAREIPALYSDRVYSKPLNSTEIRTLAQSFQEQISFVDVGTRIVSAQEGLVALSQWIVESEGENHPEEIDVQFAYGPASTPANTVTEGEFTWEAIQEAAEEFLEIVAENEQMPSIVWIAGKPTRPQDFAATLASVVISEKYSGKIALQRSELTAQKYVANDDANGLWGWVIFPENFHAPQMMEIAKLQSWTIKPALLRHVR